MKRLFFLLLVLFSTNALAAPPMTPDGLWLTKKGDVAVTITTCNGGTLCGTIHWLRADVTQTGADGQPLCGVEVLRGFRPDPEQAYNWVDGKVFVADKGDTYSAQLRQTAPDRMELRAYLGTPFLGKTKVLRRVTAADYPACKPNAAK